MLSIGQKLLLSEPSTNTDNYYVVKSGDTLYGIARKYNMTVDKLKAINNLTSNVISVGQKLKVIDNSEDVVPPIKDEENVYIVKAGDTLYAIANKFSTTVNELKQLNNLSSNMLSVGQKLKVPKNDYVTYRVVAGDTLYGIARRNNTTVTDLVNLNNLSSSVLRVGQLLLIPNK